MIGHRRRYLEADWDKDLWVGARESSTPQSWYGGDGGHRRRSELEGTAKGKHSFSCSLSQSEHIECELCAGPETAART